MSTRTTPPRPPLPPGSLGLAWRPAREADLPAWHELVRAIEDADAPAERYTVEDLREELLDGSWKDPEHRSLLGWDADGRVRAFGLVEVRPGDTRVVRAWLWGGVHPDWRRRGVGTALLAWQQAVGRAAVAAAGKDAPGRLRLSADGHLADRAALAAAAGMVPVRHFVVLRRWLRGPRATALPEAAVGEGLRLVPFAPELDEAVRRAHNEAFVDHWGSEPRTPEDWARSATGHRDFRADWSAVVLDDTRRGPDGAPEVAGYALAAAHEQDWTDGVREGWTSLVGTRRPWRRRGVAAALLTAGLRALARDGLDAAGLDVDSENPSGALGLYTRLGYEPRSTSVLHAQDV